MFASTVLLLSLSCNGVLTDHIVHGMLDSNSKLSLEKQIIDICHLTVTKPTSFKDGITEYVSLEQFKGTVYNLDLSTLHVNIDAPMDHLKLDNISLNSINENKIRIKDSGSYINYDVSLQKTQNADQQYYALFDLVHFNRLGVFNTDFYTRIVQDETSVIRLSSLWVYDKPEEIQTYHIGDTVIDVNDWSYPIRYLGFRQFTNFQTQPQFDTISQPAIQGVSNVPTRIDIYLENELLTRQDVDAGAFSISALPVVNRAGEVVVKTRDLLNRETSITLPYYSSAQLLRPGLLRTGYSVGVERVNYGLTSFDYERFLLAGLAQKGLTENWTLGAHGEILAEQQTLGFDSHHIVSKWFEALFVVGASRSDHDKMGSIIKYGLQRKTRSYALGVTTTENSSTFKQLGINKDLKPPSKIVQSYVNYYHPVFGSLGGSYTYRQGRTEPNLNLLLITYAKTLNQSLYLSLTLSDQRGNEINRGGYLSLVWVPANNYSLSSNIEKQDNAYRARMEFIKNTPIENGYGYRLSEALGEHSKFQSEATLVAKRGVYQAKYAHFKNSNNFELNAIGGVLLFDGYTKLTRKIDNSFVLIKGPADRTNIDIFYQNNVVGQLDRKGYFLVEHTLPYQENKIMLDALDLPLSSDMNSYERIVVPYFRSGVLLEFDVQFYRDVSLNLVDIHGDPIPVGAVLSLQDGKTVPVAYEGRIFARLDKNATHLKGRVDWLDQHCDIAILLDSASEGNVNGSDLGVVTCYQNE
jgi:outer membrane usher protein